MYNGLKDEEVKISREKYGSNELSKTKKDSFLRLLINTLGDPIIKILLIALAIKTIFLFKELLSYPKSKGKFIIILLTSFLLE